MAAPQKTEKRIGHKIQLNDDSRTDAETVDSCKNLLECLVINSVSGKWTGLLTPSAATEL
jgi:hypothetical protein